MMNSKSSKLYTGLTRRFSIRRELSLWMCLYALLFQLGTPLVQVAVFNGALSQTGRILTSEICSATGGVIPNDLSGQTPSHHTMACEFCSLCQVPHLDDIVALAWSSGDSQSKKLQRYPVHFTNEYIDRRTFLDVRAIRAPPVFV